MPNALADETSPYLLQHKDNPVDWMPWGDEAFSRANAEDKPLLISIGYSACHWCHVMERESFEDEATAREMNEAFVCVKVDREERPDVDAIYMAAVQAMTGSGGWPLNAFVTPDGHPFYAGTYFPPVGRQGMPAWRQVVAAIREAWQTQRDEIVTGSAKNLGALAGPSALDGRSGEVDPAAPAEAVANLRRAWDAEFGGFGGAPKFPAASTLDFLLGQGEREMALHTLRAMANGGIYDQVGGGFSRYAVDRRWVVPHFEKMLYDNALLARTYLHAWQETGDGLLRRVCEETLDWMLRELRQEEGAFASALDADSEGVEGKYYVWTLDEVRAALGDRADDAIRAFGMTEGGNFEGANIPVRATADPPDLRALKDRLYEVREQRVRPGLDDKRLTAWNALAISALADAGAVLGREDYLDAARTAAGFILESMRDADGRLLRTANRGIAKLGAYLEDHAFLVEALLTLYEATFEERWFVHARRLADETIERFADREHGGFFTTPDDHDERLPVRRKELEDTPIPSGQSSLALGLLRLAALTGERRYEEEALTVLRPLAGASGPATRYPTAFGHLLQAIAFHLGPVREVAIAGDQPGPMLEVVRAAYRPRTVLAGGEGTAVPLLEGRTPLGGRTAAYVCERFACQAPVDKPDTLARMLSS
jgi:uncharacterized protein